MAEASFTASFSDIIEDVLLASDMREGQNFVDQLPDMSLNDLPNDNTCSICMNRFRSREDPEPPVRLPCGHVMGRKCISRWLESENSCPLCRRVLFEQGNPLQGVPVAEVLDFLTQHREIRTQMAALNARLETLERENVRQNPSRRGELRAFQRDTASIDFRMRAFCSRYRNLINLLSGRA